MRVVVTNGVTSTALARAMVMMPLPAHRFTALVTMLAVFGAHAACVCHMAVAATDAQRVHPAGGQASHGCCNRAYGLPPSSSRPAGLNVLRSKKRTSSPFGVSIVSASRSSFMALDTM